MARPVTSPTAARGRHRWRGWIFLALLIVPIIEIAAIIGVGRIIGGWPTVGLLIFESLLGAWLVRREGARTWRALNEALTTGTMPSKQLADAALVLIGGTLLLTPGFVTDIVGFFFILPFTRPFTRGLLERAVRARLVSAAAGSFPGGPFSGGPFPGGSFPGGVPGGPVPPGRGPTPPAGGDTVEGRVVDR